MAVIVKYVVVRNGEEKMTFATKKEADAHDKMLDIADNLYDFLGRYEALTLDDEQRDQISLYLAKNSNQVMNIL
ncbi:MAG: YebG family protein, partial [Desulfamplus sp.]|nr:YebG family protein [Desulfamplus sp.]